MNLNVLPINVLLSHTDQWLNNPELRAKISAHIVGIALLLEVERVHGRLAGQVERRRQLALALAQLTELITQLDIEHDNLARAIFLALEALIAAARDVVETTRYQRLQSLLFPEGLSIVSRSYSYEAGAMTALESRVTEADVTELAAIPVGSQSLADWYRNWVQSGKTLGRRVHERDAMNAGSARGGSATETVDIRAARLECVNTMQTFLGALHLMNLTAETRERILGPLEASIAQALRGRADDGLPEEPPGDDVPGDEPPGDDRPGDDQPSDEQPDGELPGKEPPGAPSASDALVT
jgi:hypothetical protein